jgi:hypothetical protein
LVEKKANVWMMLASGPVVLSQPIEDKHVEFFDRIKERTGACSLKDGIIPPTPKSWDLGAMGSVTRYMSQDVRQFGLSYGCRSEIAQARRDVFNLAIRLNRVDPRIIVDDVFMFYVKAFGASDASCWDDRLGSWSYTAFQQAKPLAVRFFLIRQINWISNEYAWEQLQISSKEIGERVALVAERVEYFPDGVYIVLDSRPLTMAEAKEKTLAANLALYPEIAPIIPDLLAIDA